jgi:Ca2+-binding EF-hand superfamily protein
MSFPGDNTKNEILLPETSIPMKRILILSSGALTLSFGLFVSQALAHGHHKGHFFSKVDTNGDGQVTRVEAHAKVTEFFNEADKNKDKVVTREEADAHRAARMKDHANPEKHIEARFAREDTNKNGKIERSESRLPDKIFNKIDKNGDGVITKQEALDAFKARAAERAKNHGGQAQGDRGHGNRGGSHFERLDTNGDGKITLTEAKAAADKLFSRLDANNDNVITQAEADQAMKSRHAGKRGEGHGKKHK